MPEPELGWQLAPRYAYYVWVISREYAIAPSEQHHGLRQHERVELAIRYF
jgi:hypothetical protein